MEEQSATLTTAQAAARLGVAANSVILWADSGLLQSWRTPGGHRRISAASVQEMLDRRRDREASLRGQVIRILLVEDDPEAAKLVCDQICQVLPKARVQVVGNGFEALIQAGRSLPDLLVTDVNLPGMNGLSMIESLRSQPATEKLRVIVISSYMRHELGPFGKLPPNVPFLSKPVGQEGIRDALDRVLETRD